MVPLENFMILSKFRKTILNFVNSIHVSFLKGIIKKEYLILIWNIFCVSLFVQNIPQQVWDKRCKSKIKYSIVNCLQHFRTSFQNLAMIYKSQHYNLGFLLIFSFIGVILALSANFKCRCLPKFYQSLSTFLWYWQRYQIDHSCG